VEIIRPEPFVYNPGDSFGLSLESDLHIGSPDVDYGMIAARLQAAADRGDRIAINGDIFDLILPGDKKRYRADAVHKRLLGRQDIINAAVDWAVELLGPVAGSIDMLGDGNHEETAESIHAVNATRLLIDRLRPRNPNIGYGGYCGFIDYRFVPADREGRSGTGHRYVVFYHHGSGTHAFGKIMGFVDADLVWLGHRHRKTTDHMQRIRCPLRGDEPRHSEVRFATSGAYMTTYKAGTMSYGAKRMLPPQGKGGVRVVLTPGRNGVDVEMTT
jgi:hypothetical protein